MGKHPDLKRQLRHLPKVEKKVDVDEKVEEKGEKEERKGMFHRSGKSNKRG